MIDPEKITTANDGSTSPQDDFYYISSADIFGKIVERLGRSFESPTTNSHPIPDQADSPEIIEQAKLTQD